MAYLEKISLKEELSERRCRQIAVLHCPDYLECLDRVAKRNGHLECHKCDRMQFEADAYRKEVGSHMINHYDPGEQVMRIEGGHGHNL